MENFLMFKALEGDDGMSLLEQMKLAEANIYYKKKLCEVKGKYGEDHPEYLKVMEKVAFSQFLMGNLMEARKNLEEVVRKREKTIGEDHPDSLRVHMVISLIIMKLGNKSQADLLLAKLRKIKDSLDRNNVNFILCCLLIAISCVNLYRPSEAKELLQELLSKETEMRWNGYSLSLIVRIVFAHYLFVYEHYSEAIAYHEDILKMYSDLSEQEFYLYSLCRMEIASSLCMENKFSEAKIQLEHMLKETKVADSKYEMSRLNILRLISKCCFKQNKLEEAKGFMEEILKKEKEIYGKESFFSLNTSMEIGEILITMRDFAAAKCVLEEVLNSVEQAFGKDNRLYFNTLKLLSSINVDIGNYTEAAITLKKVLCKQLEVLGKYDHDYLETKQDLADLYIKWQNFPEALKIFNDLLKLQSLMFGADHQRCLRSKMYIVTIYLRMEQYTESAILLKELINVQSNKLGEDHMDTVYSMGLLAVTMFALGKRGKGAHIFKVFITKMKFSDGKFDFDICSCIFLLLKKVDEYENSKRVLEKIINEALEFLGNDHPFIIDCQINIAKCLLLQDKAAEAKMMFYLILENLPKTYAVGHPIYLDVKTSIAESMNLLSEHEEAIILLKEVLNIYKQDRVNDLKVLHTMILISVSLIGLNKYAEMKILVKEALMRLSRIDCRDDPSYEGIASALTDLRLLCNV